MDSRRSRKSYAGALAPLLLSLPAACAEQPGPASEPPTAGVVLIAAAQGEVESDASPAAGSGYGAYLAGLFAGHQRDLSAAADYMLQALSYDTENAQLLNRILMLVAADGRHAKAVQIARRLDAINPGHSLAALVLAVDALERDAFEEADGHLAGLPKRGLSTVTAPLLRAWLQVARGDVAGAMERAAPLKNKSGFGVLYSLHAGLMNDVAGETEAARINLEDALKLAGQPSLRLVWLTGNFFERTAHRQRAAELYRAFLARNPNSTIIGTALERAESGVAAPPVVADAKAGMAEALFNLASLLSQERAEEVALVHVYLALRLKPDFVIARVLLGEILQAQGRSTDAIAVYRQIPVDSPFSWMVRMRVAEELERMDKVDEAVAELESLAAARPERFEPLLRLGNLLRNKERFAEAVKAYDRAVARVDAPTRRHWTLYYFRGIALERLSQWSRAEQDFLLALELEPEQPFVMNYLAYSWVEKELNLDKAKSMLVRAVELRPDDGFIVDSLGWVYYRLGEYQRGVTHLERAVELRPQDPVINDHLGDAYWRVGRHQEARFQWRRALSLEPEENLVPKIEAKIQHGLKDSPEDI
ncbi:MAG: tetratricopeptide repeat protein [Kiloniellaceae bacterium]